MWRYFENTLKASKQNPNESTKYELEARKRIYPTEARRLLDYYGDRWSYKISVMKCLGRDKSIILDYVPPDMTKISEYVKIKRPVSGRGGHQHPEYHGYKIVLCTEDFSGVLEGAKEVIKFYRIKYRYSIYSEDFTIDMTYVVQSHRAAIIDDFDPRLHLDATFQIELEVEFNNKRPFDVGMQQMFMAIMDKLDLVAQDKLTKK